MVGVTTIPISTVSFCLEIGSSSGILESNGWAKHVHLSLSLSLNSNHFILPTLLVYLVGMHHTRYHLNPMLLLIPLIFLVIWCLVFLLDLENSYN
mmetsp:Transcript_5359/g.12176  ORF Transcript_5359/g.12176 Transcript_5359/m.12176 type:complete len:95 (-) Transcript_5359:478-762(-)